MNFMKLGVTKVDMKDQFEHTRRVRNDQHDIK